MTRPIHLAVFGEPWFVVSVQLAIYAGVIGGVIAGMVFK